jgi:RNA polymerase sigma factor (sigma-70 family)
MDADDRELLQRIQQGDGESFGTLFDRTRSWLLSSVIRPRVGPSDAEDVLSETYRTALDGIAAFEWRGIGLLHWLAAIARRKALEKLRSRAREASLEEIPSLLALPDDEPTREAEMIAASIRRETAQRVGATLGSLHPRYAEALKLRLLEGRSRAECATALGVTTPTFDVLLFRASKAFARCWRGE